MQLPYQPDPQPLLAALRPLGRAVLLHSADRAHPWARFDVLAAAPRVAVEHLGGESRIIRGGRTQTSRRSPFELLDALLGEMPPADVDPALPFAGGVLGLAGYDLGPAAEALPRRLPRDHRFPDLAAGLYPWAVVTDHHRRTTSLVRTPGARLPRDLDRLLHNPPPACGGTGARPRLAPEIDQATYRAAFDRVQAYIRAGDCYQVNLAVRFAARCDADPLDLYRALLPRHPAPFAGFLETPDGAVLSFSPERFLRIADGAVETAPIKGTRPRGATAAADRAEREALQASSKDRAENLMIVDLLRNDLGRSCAIGTVEVPELFAVHSFASVHHLVSTVRGRLADDVTPLGAFARAFPGGSITGAPKIRAMEIIEELEAARRGPYCGSLLMADGRGRLDASIVIRSLLRTDRRLLCWGGGGLVADSHWQAEWAEIHHKVGALLG